MFRFVLRDTQIVTEKTNYYSETDSSYKEALDKKEKEIGKNLTFHKMQLINKIILISILAASSMFLNACDDRQTNNSKWDVITLDSEECVLRGGRPVLNGKCRLQKNP